MTTVAPVRDSARIRLTAGVLAAPLFLLVSAVQLPFNPGLDLTEHAFSYLSIGPTGPLQQANFVLMGLAHIVAATALVRALTGRTAYAAAALLAADGLGQVVAGLFTLDPSNGFPAGAPPGLPQTVTTHGHLHGLGFGLSIVSWVALLVVLARWFARGGRRLSGGQRANRAQAGMAWGCAGAAAALVVTAACLTTPFGTVLLYVVLTGAWIYTALLLLRHLRDTRLSPRTDAPGPREADRYENLSAMMSRTGRRR